MHDRHPPSANQPGLSSPRHDIALGILDQSPIRSGQSPAEAIQESVDLARAAERLGYRRFWVAEHHSCEAFGGTAPEVLVAHLAAKTSSIRVGTGGVMLPNHTPLRVAEVFRVLEALHPGRIDMGIGRAPGGDPATMRALRPGSDMQRSAAFADQLADLIAFLSDTVPATHQHAGVRAQPAGPTMPEAWLLGSSLQGAALAARMGFAFAFAHFINPHDGMQALATYRRDFRPSPWLLAPRAIACVFVLCADSDRQARRLAQSRDLWGVQVASGRLGPIPSVEDALAHRYTGAERRLVAAGRSMRIVGGPKLVLERLLGLVDEYGVDEMLVLTVCFDPVSRLRSYELLAEMFGLQQSFGAILNDPKAQRVGLRC